MKPPEQMTDEELRMEIAEFCGYSKSLIGDGIDGWRAPDGLTALFYKELPNYPQDLNAMWEAEEFLIKQNPKIEPWSYDNQYLDFQSNLEDLLVAEPDHDNGWIIAERYKTTHATAKQRAIAFIKTIREIKK